MSTLSEISHLFDRYPFDEKEIEILLRCHKDLLATDRSGSFLNLLAHCSPYAFFFLPGDEFKTRIDLIEGAILPAGFGARLKEAIFSDCFPEVAHSLENNRYLEKFLEGVADCGRRGEREALRVLFDCCAKVEGDDDEKEDVEKVVASDVIALCHRLSVASDIFIRPSIDKKKLQDHLDNDAVVIDPLAKSLSAFAGGMNNITKADFINWADEKFPMMAFTVLAFVQNLIFHGKPIPPGKVPYKDPVLDQATDVFASKDSPLLFALACMTPKLAGVWHRLYSTEADGRSFNRMEWSVLGYEGPTTLLIKTEDGATFGAFASAPFKEAPHFFGDGETFLFSLDPVADVFHSIGDQSNFMYCNASWAKGHDGLPHGLGFGGTLNQPRLFVSENFNTCHAGSLDNTFQKGNLIPEDSLEQFNIKAIEIWGVGGESIIAHALEKRDEHRQTTDSVVYKARKVTDKAGFLPDLKSGLIETNLYKHREQARGRAEFVADSKHGGYSLERKDNESVPFPNEDLFNKAQ